MKKFAKMSLVAAVAVAGMTSANATDLSEAIKNVDVSGMVRYRYTDTNVKTKTGKSTVENNYDIEVTAKVPVNDIVTAVVKVDVAAGLRADVNEAEVYAIDNKAKKADGTTNPTYGTIQKTTTSVPADAKANVQIEDAYFSFALPYATVTAGKQNVPGPLVDSLNGTGIVALAPVGPVTLGAGFFNGADAKGAYNGYDDIYAVAAIGSFGPVNASVWYAKVKDLAKAYSVDVNGTVGPVTLDARYSKLNVDDLDNDNKVLKLGAEATFGMVTVNAGFAKTGDTNTYMGHGASLDAETDAKVNDFQLEQFDAATGMNDAKAFKLGVAVAPTEKVEVGLDYLQAKGYTSLITNQKGKDKVKETVLSASYMMSKNFTISSFYSMMKENPNGAKAVKTNQGRLELKYSF